MTTATIDQLSDAVVSYLCNNITSSQVAEIANKDEDKVSDILSLAQIEWDSVGCDEEWENGEQEEQTLRIELETVKAIIYL